MCCALTRKNASLQHDRSGTPNGGCDGAISRTLGHFGSVWSINQIKLPQIYPSSYGHSFASRIRHKFLPYGPELGLVLRGEGLVSAHAHTCTPSSSKSNRYACALWCCKGARARAQFKTTLSASRLRCKCICVLHYTPAGVTKRATMQSEVAEWSGA